MRTKQAPLQSLPFLMSIFDYCPESGVLSWRKRDGVPAWWNTRYAGKQPTNKDSLGYIRAKITWGTWQGYVSVHRICFLMHYGYLPENVDHINGCVSDNRAENLRAATWETNSWNRKANLGTLSGLKGVKAIRYQEGSRKGEISGYTAYIGHQGKRLYLGYFPTPELAHQAYASKEAELREEYRRK